MRTANSELKKMYEAFGLIEMATSGATLSQLERLVVTEGVTAFADWTHAAQVQAGWWQDPTTGNRVRRNPFELHALFHSEVSEAMEAHRKNNRMDDKLPNRRGLEVELADLLIREGDFVGSEDNAYEFGSVVSLLAANCADIVEWLASENVAERLDRIHNELSLSSHFLHGETSEKYVVHLGRAFLLAVGLCRRLGLSAFEAAVEKMAYNARRVDHTLEHRRDAADGKAY